MRAAVQTLQASSDFQRIAKAGQKWFCPAFVIQIAPLVETSRPPCYGLTASRRVGGAVQRNRAKRRLREMIRRFYREYPAPAVDIVLIARTDAISREMEAMYKDLLWALKRLGITL